uniref:KOW domain-containing protein n=1 Tax=Angiostrongylus cantonensis TaxID=6313 RepID=A0A0K0D8A3_ANGCA
MSSCIASVEAIKFYRGIASSGMKVHISIGFDTIMAECQFLRSEGDEYEQLVRLEPPCLCWLIFDRAIYTRSCAFYIASKLDHQGRGCRFLFHGQFGDSLKERKIRRFIRRQRIGRVERVENVRSIVCNSLFKKETKISAFEGLPVILNTGETGKIVGAFGKGGKVRVEMTTLLLESTVEKIAADETVEVSMYLKKYLGEKKIEGYLPSGLP